MLPKHEWLPIPGREAVSLGISVFHMPHVRTCIISEIVKVIHVLVPSRKLRDPDSVTLTPVFLCGCILNSLASIFGEIGGQTALEIVKFSSSQKRSIFRVPEAFLERVRIAISLIGYYQEEPCHFQVLSTSRKPLDFEEPDAEFIAFN